MNDKKFTIKTEDMARLKSLLREEESRLDADNPSDAELDLLERELQQKLKRLAGGEASESMRTLDERQRQWQAIERRVHTTSASDQKDLPAPDKLVALPRRVPPLKWARWAGAMAAAALALLFVGPALQKPESITGGEGSLMVSKGTSSPLPASCEVSVLQTVNGSGTIVPSADGLGYEGPSGTAFQLTVRCDRPGFLNVLVEGSNTMSIRNLKVEAGEIKGILHEGKLASFVLQSQRPWVISGLLSDREISSETALPRTESEAERILGKLPLLWFDRIAVKGTNS